VVRERRHGKRLNVVKRDSGISLSQEIKYIENNAPVKISKGLPLLLPIKSDPALVSEYSLEIFHTLLEKDASRVINPNYIDQQSELSWSMRSILIDWIVQVSFKFNLLPETLFLSINYLDTFLSLKPISVQKFQLVGVTCLMVASKFEEIYPPKMKEWIYSLNSSFSSTELTQAERYFLKILNFNLCHSYTFHFLRRISSGDGYSIAPRTLTKYLLELSLLDERFLKYTASQVVAGCFALSYSLLKLEWTKKHESLSGYSFNEIREISGLLLDLLKRPGLSDSFIVHKYSLNQYGGVSQWLKKMFY
jgi:hypothetical protein